MKITITGATGFIGQWLVNRLLADRHDLTILSRSRDGGTRPRYLTWDSAAGSPPTAALEGADAVIHLAGEPVAQRWTRQAKERIRSSRIDGTHLLVDALAANPPKILISASAIGIYGNRGAEILTEASAPGSGFLEDLAVEWEHQASRAAKFGVRVVHIRIGIVLGKRGGALEKMLPVFYLGLGGTLGLGRQWMSWIHVDDLAGIIITALNDETLRGPVNGVSPNPVTNAEFTRTLGRVVHRPALFPVPGFGLKLIFGEMSQVMLGSQRVIPEVAQAAGFRFRYPDLEGALAQIVSPSG